MRRRSWIWGLILLTTVLATAGAVLGTILKREPAFYTDPKVTSSQPDDAYRASDTLTRLSELQKAVKTDPEWSGRFTQDDLNAFFREDPATNNLVEPRAGGFTAPRVVFDGDRMRIAARYGCGFWSTIVSAELRVWVIADEPNLFAVEVVSLTAGSLPVSKRWLMDRLTAAATENAIGVTWFRKDGNPVAACRWLPNQSRPNTLLRTLAVTDGRFEVGGRNLSGQ